MSKPLDWDNVGKHTPAPWRKTRVGAQVLSGTETICHLPSGVHRQSDAWLIAAAPDLLEAGKWALELLRNQEPVIAEVASAMEKELPENTVTLRLEMAIARAEGRQP